MLRLVTVLLAAHEPHRDSNDVAAASESNASSQSQSQTREAADWSVANATTASTSSSGNSNSESSGIMSEDMELDELPECTASASNVALGAEDSDSEYGSSSGPPRLAHTFPGASGGGGGGGSPHRMARSDIAPTPQLPLSAYSSPPVRDSDVSVLAFELTASWHRLFTVADDGYAVCRLFTQYYSWECRSPCFLTTSLPLMRTCCCIENSYYLVKAAMYDINLSVDCRTFLYSILANRQCAGREPSWLFQS